MQVNNTENLSILIVLNERSGNSDLDFRAEITAWFDTKPHTIHWFPIQARCTPAQLMEEVNRVQPDRVLAVGGDGTIKLVADALMETTIPIGIIPAGSANGLAKELGIPTDMKEALAVSVFGRPASIHLLSINGETCIHLGDIGLNAFLVKKFEAMEHRGMWGYFKAAWHVFWSRYRMQIEMRLDGKLLNLHAFMVVVANGTMYGTGARINPVGSLTDNHFELVVIKRISFAEVFKMWFTHRPYHPRMTALYQTQSVEIKSRKPVHFQVDGEYLGKVNHLAASILPHRLEVMVPAQPAQA